MSPRRRTSCQSLATVLAVLGVSFGALMFAAPRASAVTYVSGVILSDTTWGLADTTYVVTQNVTVAPGITLTILPGTTVRFNPQRALFVDGTLIADGAPGNEILFTLNNTMLNIPAQGVQFNAPASGSVRWSILTRLQNPLVAIGSSPTFAWNTIDRAQIGIALDSSDATVMGNLINGTEIGIQASSSGTPWIQWNTVTNVSSWIAAGIYVLGGANAELWGNTIRLVQGVRGSNAAAVGDVGGPGGNGIAILVTGASTANVQGNAVDEVYGGRGGDGQANPGGIGGNGGAAGGAAGIVVGGTPWADIDDNWVTSINGGRGGNGGGGPTTVLGGNGGEAGGAYGIQVLGASGGAWWYTNWIESVNGGVGGTGGDGLPGDGRGGAGGQAGALTVSGAMNGDASGNTIRFITGGAGGYSTATGTGNADGGGGGDAYGVGITGSPGNATVHSNSFNGITGGDGGRGGFGGGGGNATGVWMFGNLDGQFNGSAITGNWAQNVAGGDGALGNRNGGAGGTATGLAAVLVTPLLGGNGMLTIQGGNGGDAFDGTDGGRGGDATGIAAYYANDGWSSGDWMNTVARGSAGAGPPTLASYGIGYILVGDASFRTRLTIENGSIANVGDYDIFANDYADGTTINTGFNPANLQVVPTATLMVKNYLGVEAYWPDGWTPVAGASVRVEDEGTPVYDLVSPTGLEYWMVVTDRWYKGTTTPTDNRTEVFVSHLAYNFFGEPRLVDMAASNTQPFVMIDEEAPTSTADALPAYTTTSTFPVNYTASDGGGLGLRDITLWYRKDGAGWTSYATQPAGSAGTFNFATVGDGTYEFATIADDFADNVEPGPSANETWTIVDTVLPASRVSALAPWQTVASFLVAWGPDPGVTDIATYTVQYDRGLGWTDWLTGVTQTSATFNSLGDGIYQFRSIATDWAGNVELVAGNDTWTYVDTQIPASAVDALPPFTYTLTFTVSWGPLAGTTDVASYRIEVNDDGAGWSPWIASTPSTSASFGGAEGHTYEFRSIATDWSGNVEPAPAGNDTWTHVDTIRPGSHVDPLAAWQTSLAFPVSWGPDVGVTDIARYTVQYNRGFGWTNWLVDTTQTGATFTATTNALYQFRSIATDTSGNVETVALNDTWTIIDTERPWSFVNALAPWQTALTFLVRWSPESDDVASYRIQMRDNGSPWADWIPFTTAQSANFTGVDDHTYEYRATATDWAGNVQTPNPNNDTWTRIDATPPDSRVLSLPPWEASLVFGLSWGPVSPTADIVTYTLEASDDGGPWTPVAGYVDTTLTSGTFTGLDGHSYGFRTLAKDRAGNSEVASPGNDTWTTVDVSPPTTTASLAGTMGGAQWYVGAVTVTLSATDATSGVASIMVRVDNGTWQTYASPVLVAGDGNHAVAFHATDAAGVTESVKVIGFRIDTTAPTTSTNLAGTLGDNGWHISAVAVSLIANDTASGVSSISYRLDGGSWSTYATPVSVTTDGSHTVEYYATDAAGLVEATKSVAFRIDATDPLVVTTAPRGAGTNTTPVITVTFSEGMNRAAVESAFTISPDMNGAFAWSADNRTVTFVPDRALQTGTSYFVAIGTNAKDMAGNALPQTVTFSFETGTPPPTVTGSGDWIWIIAVVAAALGGSAFIALRRLGARGKPVPAAAEEKEANATIDDVFLLYRDGILIKHETRRLKPDIDTDILSGMLTAVQSFVKDSFRSEEGELDEMTFGEMHILIGRGKWVILAAMVQGDGTVAMRAQIEKCIAEMEAQRPGDLERWDGNMAIAKVLSPFIKKLIRGEYV